MIRGGAWVRLNWWQQEAVAVGSAVAALLDPWRADLITVLGETTGKTAFERVRRKKQSPEGQKGHTRGTCCRTPLGQPMRGSWDRGTSPLMTGRRYGSWRQELAYIAMRAREVHDFWHTLFGLPTNLIGESVLKVIEFQQMYLPMCLMSAVGGTVGFSERQRRLFYQHYFPWAVKAGMQCTDLTCVYYEKHFHEDLEVVRQRWGIVPSAPPPKH